MIDPYLNLFRVNPEDGSLLNTDGCFEIEALGENGAQKFLEMGKTVSFNFSIVRFLRQFMIFVMA